jgi:hypothetical protein
LKAVRGPEGTEDQVKSVSESLSLEFRYLSRLIRRRDFYEIGSPSQWPASQWAAIEAKSEIQIDQNLFPILPNIKFDDVFDRNVEIDGHHFKLRPRWEHKTVRDVKDEDIDKLATPLTFSSSASNSSNSSDRTTELHVPTETNMGRRITETVLDTIGYEVVPGLGETSTTTTTTTKDNNNNNNNQFGNVKPLQTEAFVPNNVNFYEMARHPWEDTPHSWRSNGFTDTSKQYFEKKYQEAVKAVYDPENRETYEHWPPRGNTRNAQHNQVHKVQDPDALEPEEILLRDRFWGAVEKASSEVESWAKEARATATAQKFVYPLEATTPEEKIYDDEYYRWFIRPGHHPNPSGILKGGLGAPSGGAGKKKQQNEGEE